VGRTPARGTVACMSRGCCADRRRPLSRVDTTHGYRQRRHASLAAAWPRQISAKPDLTRCMTSHCFERPARGRRLPMKMPLIFRWADFAVFA
jgi:hypothetical protein